MAEEINPGDIVNYINEAILTCPEDDVWDTVHDWILIAQNQTITSISNTIHAKVIVARDSILLRLDTYHKQYSDDLAIIRQSVSVLLQDMLLVLQFMWDNTGGILNGVANIVDSITGGVSDIIGTTISSIASGIAQIIPAIGSAVSVIVSTLGSTIANLASSLIHTITTGFASVMSTITTTISSLLTSISGFFSALVNEIRSTIDWVAEFALVKLPEYLNQGVTVLMDTLMNFTMWVPQLLGAGMTWFQEDVPGASPRGEGILTTIFQWIVNAFRTVMEWVATYIIKPIISALVAILSAIADVFRPVMEVFLSGVLDLLTSLGPISPSGATGAMSGLANIGMLIVGMLGAMTVAGHLIHPFQSVGLGEISAIVWDMSQFRVVTGAFMGVVSALAVRQPLTYYLNKALRPKLPDERSAAMMMSREYISREQYSNLMGFYGIPDEWHEPMTLLTETKVGYFALANIARNGVFQRELFERDCRRAGYATETIEMLLDMYQKNALEAVRGQMSGYAITRYKEGFSTASEFREELKILGYSNDQIPVYEAAAELAYATDYLSDLKSAYYTAVTRGQISLDGYRSALAGLGIVPERVEAFVLRARAVLKPKEKLGPTAPPVPTYETDYGKIVVDTIRRERRKNLISDQQETARLIQLGMEPDMAEAIAANDNARLAEKAGEE